MLAENYFDKSFKWNYGGLEWTWNLSIPQSLYDAYKRVSVSDRTRYGLAGYGFLVTTQDYYVIQVANGLHNASVKKGYGAYDEVSFVLAFVQSLPYTLDSVTTTYDEYPRFPLETLVDDGGDCEDTAILFATLMLILNYDVIFISPPSHYAVGVWGNNLQGSYYTYNDKPYYCCETTGDNFKIGDIPSEYQNSLVHLYSFNQNEQYVPGQDATRINNQWLILFLVAVLAGMTVGMIVLAKISGIRKDKEVGPQPLPPPPPQPSLSDCARITTLSIMWLSYICKLG